MNDGPAIDLAIHLESNDFSRARSAALRLLSARSRSVAEMRERLGKKFASEAVEQTVALLTAEGLLNDAAFAQQWRQSRERRKPRSSRMIEHELKQLGIADDIIDGALEDYDSLDAAYRSVSKYAGRQADNDRTTFDRRVSAFLGRRAFDPGVTRQTLQRLREELRVGNSATDGIEEE